MANATNFTTAQALIMLNEMINGDRAQMIQEKYRDELHYADRYNLHRIITGKALNGAKKVITRGGTPDEIDRVLVYLQVCIDSMKHKLDWKKCQQELEIKELFDKYATDED